MLPLLHFNQCPNKEGPNFDYFLANFEGDQTNDIDFDLDEKIKELYEVKQLESTSLTPFLDEGKKPIFQTNIKKNEYLGKKHKKSPYNSEYNQGMVDHVDSQKRKIVSNINNIKKKGNRQDSIISDIKRRLYKNVKKCINMHLQLKNINTSMINGYCKEDHLNFLKLKVEDLFTGKLSKHHNKIDDNYNKKEIDSFISKGENSITILLNKTFREILEIYKGNEPNIFEGFKTLEDEIKNFKEKGEGEFFIKKYEDYVKNFEEKIENIKTRNRKKNNKK